MFRYTAPIILIIVAVTGFLMFTNPLYKETTLLRAQTVSYNEALDNSKALESERDKLTQKYNTISVDDLTRLEKFLPDSVDNIRLILEIEKIASPYGMVLKDVKYDTTTADATAQPQTSIVSGGTTVDNKVYGTWNLEFSTEGNYANFTDFLKDLESNLRVVDISSISFSSDTQTGPGVNSTNSANAKPSDSYKYDFKIKTYWLKN